MWGIWEAVLAFLIAAAVLSFGWLLFGRLVTPVKTGKDVRLYCLLRARGDAENLQQTVKSLQWMDSTRVLRARIMIVDDGLSEEGRKMAETLIRQKPELVLCEMESLSARSLEKEP